MQLTSELHYEIVNKVFGTRLLISALNEKIDKASILKRSELIKNLQAVEEDIRTLKDVIDSQHFEKQQNIIHIIDHVLAAIFSSREQNFHFKYNTTSAWDALPTSLKILIYRCVEEGALQSIHISKATHTCIELELCDTYLNLSIINNGKPLRVNQFKNTLSYPDKSIQIKSKTNTLGYNSDTHIHIQIPLKQDNSNHELIPISA